MDTARCPACNAAVASGAPWCTLCFADLRAKPEPTPEPVVAEIRSAAPIPELLPQPVPEPATAADWLTFDLPTAKAATATPSDQPTQAAVAVAEPNVQHVAAAEPEATWPCTVCAASVPMSESICSACGASFLSGSDISATLVVPGVGDLATASNGTRLVVGLVAAVGFAVVILIVASILGLVF